MDTPKETAPLTGKQWKALVAAWLGWAFDGLDGFLYIMVAGPFVTQLVAREHGLSVSGAADTLGDEIRTKSAIIQALFLVGWALGGVIFGRLGDRIGRSRTLSYTVLTYACFTGLSFFATSWWHLLIFRFIAALGIGGEWAAGSALVSETLPGRCRSWASATLQSGYMVGCIAAALTSKSFAQAQMDPKWVFVVGVIPAFVTLWIRRAVPEPEAWAAQAKSQPPPPIMALFSRELWSVTVRIILLAGIALTTVWAFWFFLPGAIRGIGEVKTWDKARIETLVSNVTIASLACNIVGNYFATYLARFTTYRVAFTFLFAAGLACFAVGFRKPLTLETVYLVPCVVSFFILGVFGLFPLYIPGLFPTLLRTLGGGLTYNIGRLISAAGTMGTASLVTIAGGPEAALWWVGLLYIPGIVVAAMAPRSPTTGEGASR